MCSTAMGHDFFGLILDRYVMADMRIISSIYRQDTLLETYSNECKVSEPSSAVMVGSIQQNSQVASEIMLCKCGSGGSCLRIGTKSGR
jgi:hypothetical protein